MFKRYMGLVIDEDVRKAMNPDSVRLMEFRANIKMAVSEQESIGRRKRKEGIVNEIVKMS